MKKYLIIFLIFLFSISLRLWNLNNMGRTWDEETYIRWGYNFVSLIQKGDFTNPYLYKISASPPLSSYFFGVMSRFDIHNFDSSGKPIFNYDFTNTRLISVLFSSLTVVLVILFGWKHISPFVGIVAGVILAMLPLSVGYGQLATLESLILFFFTASVISFLRFIEAPSMKNTILAGIILGLAQEVKYTNILLFPLLIWIYLIYLLNKKTKKRDLYKNVRKIVVIFLIAFVTFFILWPMPWFHLQDVLSYNRALRHYPYSVPEVFFGKLILVPKIYYLIYFLITTPLGILIFFFLGLFSIRFIIEKERHSHKSIKSLFLNLFLLIGNNKKWIYLVIVAWFIFPFIQSLYNFRQHGIRYIIEIYAPFSLIAAIGADWVVSFFSKKIWIKSLSVFLIGVYLFLILFKLSPYYLDYFNIVVGGTEKVYKKNLFQLGWWGQGIREAAYYIGKHAEKGSIVGIALSPSHVMPFLPNQKVETFNPDKSYDYVIVNYYNILREGFDDTNIKKNYVNVYEVKADDAILVTIYKQKT